MQGEIHNEPVLNVSGFVQLLCNRTPTGGGIIVGKDGFGFVSQDDLYNLGCII